MKKSRKLVLRLVPVFLVLTLIAVSTANVFAIEVKDPEKGREFTTLTNFFKNGWATAATIIQILAIAAIIIAGLRYMFASANEKADIKTQTITLVAGAILVFAAVPAAKFVANIANQVLKE